MVRAQWRESVQASDGGAHEHVLAVALKVTSPAEAAWPLRLRTSAYLRVSNGRSRRSGKFAVAGQLKAVAPGATEQGWLVFENVEWDALRGNMQPPASRFTLTVPVGVDGSAIGSGVWMVDAWGFREGDVRRVTLPVLEASVGRMVL